MGKKDKPVLNHSVYKDNDHLDRQEKLFNEDYGFKKGIPPRSPANSAWHHEAVVENEPFMDGPRPYSTREQALMVGAVHGFGHKKSQMHGAHRHSGHPKAHRIGKR